MNTWVFKTPTLVTKPVYSFQGAPTILSISTPVKYAVGEQDGVFNVLDGGYLYDKRAKHVLDTATEAHR